MSLIPSVRDDRNPGDDTARGSGAPADPRRVGQRYRAPARLIGGQFQIESRGPVWILAGLSLILSALIFPPVGFWPLAFFALTPWAVAACTAVRARSVYLPSYVLGVGYFLIHTSWLAPVTPPGYVVLSLCFGAVFPLAAWPIRHMFRRHGASLAIALPIVWTAIEYLRSQTLVGFPWYLLGHSLHRVPVMIQIADLVGAWGVSFVVAMVNGWFTDLLIQPIMIWRRDQPERTTRLPIGSMATLVIVMMTLLYGALALPPASPTDTAVASSTQPATGPAGSGDRAPNESRAAAAVGPLVAVVQHDFPSFVDSNRAARTSFAVIYEAYMALVRQAAAERPDLIVLPETAWYGYFNDEFLNADAVYLEKIRAREFPSRTLSDIEAYRNWCRETRERLIEVARSSGATIVTGAGSIEWKPLEIPQRVEKFNSAYAFSPDPSAAYQRYDKVHLVLFGEFVPFRYGRLHAVYRWLNSLTPWGASGVEYSLSFGKDFRPFEVAAPSMGGRRLRAATPICYEDTVPYVARAFIEVAGRTARGDVDAKPIDLLLNISNDGWFAHSSELEAHLAASVFRAVEHRLGVARAVNTGASALIDPSGRILARVRLRRDRAARLRPIEATLQELRAADSDDRRMADLLVAMKSQLTSIGPEFGFMADRLGQLAAAASLSTTADRAAQQAEFSDQVDEDLRTIRRWQSRPWTAPGYAMARLPVDPRRTIYTRWGDWFPTACWALAAAMALDWLLHRVRGRPRNVPTAPDPPSQGSTP